MVLFAFLRVVPFDFGHCNLACLSDTPFGIGKIFFEDS